MASSSFSSSSSLPSFSSSRNHDFSIEIPAYKSDDTVDRERTLLIMQNGNSLEISLMTNEDFYEVKSEKIKGLPSHLPIPQAFFESCKARVLGQGAACAVVFKSVQGHTSASSESLQSPWPSRALQNLPTDVKDLAPFFANPVVTNYEVEQIKGVGIFLDQIQTTVLAGASGLDIAFLAVSNFGYAAPMQSLKNKYRNLAQALALGFGSIQANNIRVLDAFSSANRRLSTREIEYILDPLKAINKIVVESVAKCQELKLQAESLRESIQQESDKFAEHRDRFQKLQDKQKQNEKKLENIQEEIEKLERELIDEISKIDGLDANQSVATLKKWLSFGIFHFTGNKTDYTENRFDLKSKLDVYRERLSQQRRLEQERMDEIRLARDNLLDELSGIQGDSLSEEQARELFFSALGVVIPGLDQVGTGLANLSRLFHNIGELSLLGLDKVGSFQAQHSSSSIVAFSNARVASFIQDFEIAGLCWLAIASQGRKTIQTLEEARTKAFEILQLTEPDFKKHLVLAKAKLQESKPKPAGPESEPVIEEV